MPDVVGYRAKFGVIIPSTNTVVEHDYSLIGPSGITFHSGRMYIAEPAIASDEEFEQLIAQITSSLEIAIRDVLTCQPDYMVMGMSAGTFWNGVRGNEEFEQRVEELTRLRVSTGASACRAGLERLGAQTIAVLSPYQPVADKQVTRFFEEAGFRVAGLKGLRCPTATSIAEVSEPALVQVLRELDRPEIGAIVQVGTNLSMVRLADEAERWLGKPVLAINATTLWHALRANGFSDRVRGFGILLREH